MGGENVYLVKLVAYSFNSPSSKDSIGKSGVSFSSKIHISIIISTFQNFICRRCLLELTFCAGCLAQQREHPVAIFRP